MAFNGPSLSRFFVTRYFFHAIIPVYVTHPQVSIAPLSYASNKHQCSLRQHPHRQFHCSKTHEGIIKHEFGKDMSQIQMGMKQGFIPNHQTDSIGTYGVHRNTAAYLSLRVFSGDLGIKRLQKNRNLNMCLPQVSKSYVKCNSWPHLSILSWMQNPSQTSCKFILFITQVLIHLGRFKVSFRTNIRNSRLKSNTGDEISDLHLHKGFWPSTMPLSSLLSELIHSKWQLDTTLF